MPDLKQRKKFPTCAGPFYLRRASGCIPVKPNFTVCIFIHNRCCQYNGFTSDGDYNRDIPDQNQNSDVVKFAVQSSEPDKESGNGLCQTCNLNQVILLFIGKWTVPTFPNLDLSRLILMNVNV